MSTSEKMEARVYRWAPSTARNVLSTVGLTKKECTVPVFRFAVLRGALLEYYHQEDSYVNHLPPSRSWILHQYCRVSETFVYHFDKSSNRSWYPLSTKEVDRCTIWCFTITWPERQGDGLNMLQIGFEDEQLAEAWHKAVLEIVEKLTSAEDRKSQSILKKMNVSPLPPASKAKKKGAKSSTSKQEEKEEEDSESVGTWYAMKHVRGVRVFMESEDEAMRNKEEGARMISCTIHGDPQTVFEKVWNFESYSHANSNASFLKVVKHINEHRRVIHVQYPYRGNALLKHIMPTRVVLVEVTWSQECDGTFVILFSNHPQCNQYAQTTEGLVAAKMNAAVTIAPLKPEFRLRNSYSHESLMTVVMRFEPGGWFNHGSVPRIVMNSDSFFLQSMVDWFISIRERTEQERFVSKPLKKAMISVPAESAGYKVEQVVKRVTSTALQTFFRPSTSRLSVDESGGEEAPYRRADSSKGMNSNLDPKYWSSASAAGLRVRGKTYLEDRIKIKAEEPMFELYRVDLFEFPSPSEHVAEAMDYVRENPEEFFYIVQLMVPGPPHYSIVAAFKPKDKKACLEGDSPFSKQMQKFVYGSDDDRNQIFKLIPSIVEGSWIVQKAVGNTPAILGKKIRIAYHKAKNYIELDFDIASSAMAANIVRLVSSATKSVVVDMAFLNEGHCEEELPEQLIGILRLKKVDLSIAKRVDLSKAKSEKVE